MKLKGKIAVITGASSGLGKALTRTFLESGCLVIASSDNKTELKNVARGLGAFSFAADVTKEKDISNLAAYALKKFGRIDVWVNNAGITAPNLESGKMDMRLAHRVMEVNFFGTLYGALKSLEIMKKQKSGTIINIISVRALSGHARLGIYSSSKWAVRGFTEALAPAAKVKGVSVIAVYPGGMKTKLHGENRPTGYNAFMEPAFVAGKIVRNLETRNPKRKLIVNN